MLFFEVTDFSIVLFILREEKREEKARSNKKKVEPRRRAKENEAQAGPE
jgi:hypothetical protein